MNNYLEKHALFPSLIVEKPSDNLSMTVVIPCYDEPNLIASLESLKNCDATQTNVEVIVIINDGEHSDESIKFQNQNTFEQASNWASENSTSFLRFHIIYKKGLRKKIAGVGTARKIGMDEAVRRLELTGRSDGVIICFDADSLCGKNYLATIENHFFQNPKTQAASIHYEHPLEGEEYAAEIYEAITKYELHLRYYVHAQKYAGFPWAIQTIGSSMAVRCNAYQQQGGMNKRKAGEDFYFIHKFTPLNAHAEIRGTTVIPSPRKSHRVPFGTGKAVNDLLEKKEEESIEFYTYDFRIFEDLKPFLEVAPNLLFFEKEQLDLMKQNLPESILKFLIENNFDAKLAEIQANTTNSINFGTRLFRWFNAFMVMKFVHFARDHFYPNVKIEKAANVLLQKFYFIKKENPDARELLDEYRQKDRSIFF